MINEILVKKSFLLQILDYLNFENSGDYIEPERAKEAENLACDIREIFAIESRKNQE